MVDTSLAQTFRALHDGPAPLLLPNAWDVGSARILASLGFSAIATTSSGHAATLGRPDGGVSRAEALSHATELVAATDLPVSADLESGFAESAAGVGDTFGLAVEAGLAGASIEDFTGRDDDPVHPVGVAVDRVAAAAEAAHRGPRRLVLTARCENFLHGRPDLTDTIDRLQRYQEAGADVLYAPGLTAIADIRTLVRAVDRPVNVLAMAGVPPVAELAEVGVRRVSVGGGLAFAALGALVGAATELRETGSYDFTAAAATGRSVARSAFGA